MSLYLGFILYSRRFPKKTEISSSGANQDVAALLQCSGHVSCRSLINVVQEKPNKEGGSSCLDPLKGLVKLITVNPPNDAPVSIN